MKPKKNILIIKFSNLSRQPRVYRQIIFLEHSYNVFSAGFDKPASLNKNRHFNIKIPISKYGLLDKLCWNLPVLNRALVSLNHLNKYKFDLIIAHDPFTLPISFVLAKESGAKVLLDAHEYTPRQYEDQWIHRFFFMKIWDLLCRQYLPKADAIITVCRGLAEEYNKNYGVSCEVITNASYYSDLRPQVSDKNRIKIIYHGAVHQSRRTEDMISLIDHLDDRFHLDLMIVKDSSRYFRKLSDLAEQHPRVTLRDPVPMPDIPERINGYDIGLFLLSPETFSYRMALPNKLFEFIQGRLAVAIWPSPEMAKIVNEYKCGIVSEDFTIESMARQLNSLSTKDIEKFKMNSHKAAGYLCAEKNKDILLNIVEKLLR
jgi:hypothetical protein